MWLRIIICLICIFCFFIEGWAEDLPPKSTIGLIYTTNINYALASWDTVYVVIVDSVGGLVDTVWLSSNGSGRWTGYYLLDGLPPGSYTKIIHYDYEGDIYGERESFAIIDTLELQGTASGLTVAQIWDMDTTDHTQSATMGWYQINYGGICGEGSKQIRIKVYEADVDSEICENCEVKMFLAEDSDFSDRKIISMSGSNGFTPIVGVDTDSYMVVVTQPDWTFDIETLLVEDVDTLQSFYLTGLKSDRSDTTVVLYGYVRDAGWNFVEGAEVTVKLDMREPIVPTISGSSDIVITSVMDTTDAAGKWQVIIIPNGYISPSRTRYKVTYEKENTILEIPERIVTVPWSETDININSL